MDTVKGIAILVALLFVASTFYLFVQASARASQLEAAQETNKLTLELLRVQGARCSATRTDFSGVGNCIRPLLLPKDFKEDSFSNPKEDEFGYLVIKNVGSASYASDEFTFFFNRELRQEGCTIPGNITQGITCRFNFMDRCDDGDVLEAMYTKDDVTTKVFTKTC
jgi:hypothetical protein